MSLTIPVGEIVSDSTSPLLACPPDWERRRLGDVAEIINGAAFSSSRFSRTDGRPLIRIRDIANDSTSTRYTGDYEERFIVNPGELLVGMDGEFKSHLWRGPEALLNQRVCKIVPDESALLLGYLAKLLPGYLKAIHDVTSSTTVTHLSSRDVADIPIPVPSLRDQEQFVRRLDGFAGLTEVSRTEVRRARALLATVRISLMAAACTGRLTKTWRDDHPNVESAHSLVDGIRRQRRTHRSGVSNAVAESGPDADAPPTWAATTIGSLVDVATGATPLRSESRYYGGSTPWITSGAVNQGLITIAEETITPLALSETNAKVFAAGTLLVAMYGEGQTRGRVAELGIDAATNQAVAALTFDDANSFLRPYLRMFFEYNYFRIRSQSAGGVQENLNLALVRNLPIAVPPVEEQREILARVKALALELDVIEGQVSKAHNVLKRLDDAILAQTMRGDMPEDGA